MIEKGCWLQDKQLVSSFVSAILDTEGEASVWPTSIFGTEAEASVGMTSI